MSDPLITDDKEEIETFTHMLAEEWDLDPVTVEWSRMKRCLGSAKRDVEGRRTIKYSEPTFVGIGTRRLVEEFGVRDDILENTIRHEMAHLLEYSEVGNGGHGRSWRTRAMLLSADPERTTHMPDAVEKLMAPYYYQCNNCKQIIRYLYRKPGSNANWRYCVECSDERGVRPRQCKLDVSDNPEQVL